AGADHTLISGNTANGSTGSTYAITGANSNGFWVDKANNSFQAWTLGLERLRLGSTGAVVVNGGGVNPSNAQFRVKNISTAGTEGDLTPTFVAENQAGTVKGILNARAADVTLGSHTNHDVQLIRNDVGAITLVAGGGTGQTPAVRINTAEPN